MQEIEGLVSVVIPAYNAALVVGETIASVKQQTYTNWEIIVVNDGSVDNTSDKVREEADPRIRLVEQKNAGVSAARNKGLEHSRGEFVIFLDADDLMKPAFIEIRIAALVKEKELGFVAGLIETFPVKTATLRAAIMNPAEEILFFDKKAATVPSNYMFRRATLVRHDLRFNTKLSSTADRFFILQIARFTRGRLLENENGILLYRISPTSMSHVVSPGLILDNEQFYKEMDRAGLLPRERNSEFRSLFFYSLGLGFAKVRHFGSFGRYFLRSFAASPAHFFRLLFKKMAQDAGIKNVK